MFDYGKMGRSQYAVSEAGRGWLKSGTGVGEEAENEEEEELVVVEEEEEEGGGGVVFEKVVGNQFTCSKVDFLHLLKVDWNPQIWANILFRTGVGVIVFIKISFVKFPQKSL